MGVLNLRFVAKMKIAFLAIAVSACDMMGSGKVTPVIKRGPPAAALEKPEDVERVGELVPKDNSYANKMTSVSLTVSGTCITQSVAVSVSVTNATVKVTLDCDENSGEFGSTLDLSTVPDGEVEIGFAFLKTKTSTSPIYELTRTIIKDTEEPPTFTVPASLSESQSRAITINEVEGAALYRTIFTPSGGGAAIGPIETTTTSVPVTGLTVGTNYTVSVSVLDAAGNKTEATNTGTFLKTDLDPPTGMSILVAGGAAYTTSTTVNLTLAATDASAMYITNTAGCGSGGSWETFSTSKAGWSLAQTNATATVYAKFRDDAGNETSCVSDTIIHDDVVPTL
ncbi:hypothetical protein EBZ80_22255, partial [bacterium]|nr:hypothetical protein [bacterium]